MLQWHAARSAATPQGHSVVLASLTPASRTVLVAATVIGSDAKGTMNRAVSKLRVTYEKVVFPELDAARSQLGAAIDIQSAHVKVRPHA